MEGYARHIQYLLQSLAEPASPLASGSSEGSLQLMKAARMFYLQPEVVALLEQTDNRPHYQRLPYPVIWLEAPFEHNQMRYPGVLMWEAWSYPDPNSRTGFSLSFERRAGDTRPPSIYYEFYSELNFERLIERDPRLGLLTQIEILAQYGEKGLQRGIPKGWWPYQRLVTRFWGEGPLDFKETLKLSGSQMEDAQRAQHDKEHIDRMVANFLDFLYSPQVKLVNLERSERNVREKRERYGVTPPPITRVVLRGELKRYVDALKREEPDVAKWRVSHAFDVRGHFRHLKDERYRPDPENRCRCGCRRCILIPPHTRGRGLFVKKEYELSL